MGRRGRGSGRNGTLKRPSESSGEIADGDMRDAKCAKCDEGVQVQDGEPCAACGADGAAGEPMDCQEGQGAEAGAGAAGGDSDEDQFEYDYSDEDMECDDSDAEAESDDDSAAPQRNKPTKDTFVWKCAHCKEAQEGRKDLVAPDNAGLGLLCRPCLRAAVLSGYESLGAGTPTDAAAAGSGAGLSDAVAAGLTIPLENSPLGPRDVLESSGFGGLVALCERLWAVLHPLASRRAAAAQNDRNAKVGAAAKAGIDAPQQPIDFPSSATDRILVGAAEVSRIVTSAREDVKRITATQRAADTGRSTSAWAAGTGYGGSTSRARLTSRPREDDPDLAPALGAILAGLKEIASTQPEPPTWWCSELTPPLPAYAALLATLPDALLTLLCTSVLEISQRVDVFRKVLALVRTCAQHELLLPLIALPADVLAGQGAPGAPRRAVMDQLEDLYGQAKMQARFDVSDQREDVDLKACAVDITDTCVHVRAACAKYVELYGELFEAQIAACRDSRDTFAAGLPDVATLQAALADGAARAAAAPAVAAAAEDKGAAEGDGAPDAAEAKRVRYKKAMAKFLMVEADLKSHYYASQADADQSTLQGETQRKWARRIMSELSTMESGLPLEYDATILLAWDPNNLALLRAVVFGTSGQDETPYAHAPFVFDIFLPPLYPTTQPKVKFLTTGGGRVRFNPNLYAEGKVCLSLLGTWQGPSWDPASSTLTQVLISIQAMVLCRDPYLNEPGWEEQQGAGRRNVVEYSLKQRYHTVAWALLPAITRLHQQGSYAELAEGIATHLALQCDDICATLDRWQREASEWLTDPGNCPGSGMDGVISDTCVLMSDSQLQRTRAEFLGEAAAAPTRTAPTVRRTRSQTAAAAAGAAAAQAPSWQAAAAAVATDAPDEPPSATGAARRADNGWRTRKVQEFLTRMASAVGVAKELLTVHRDRWEQGGAQARAAMES